MQTSTVVDYYTKKMLRMEDGMVWLFWATDLTGSAEEVAENQRHSGDMSCYTVLENLGCSKMKPARSKKHHIPHFFAV